MSLDPNVRRSRRALLAAAASAAAGVAVAQLARPEAAAAAPYNLQAETVNTTTASTTIAGSGFDTLKVTASIGGVSAIVALATEEANGVTAIADTSDALHGVATTGTGAYGYSDSGFGIDGFCNTGVGVRGSTNTATGVLGCVGAHDPGVPQGVALFGSVSAPTQTGIQAAGRVVFPDRSGRRLVAKGASSVTFAVLGVKSTNFAIATLGARRTGRWVAAVACGTNKITIYLNAAVTSATYVSWLVLG